MTTGLMAGKRGLIMGLANNRSIAWGIAKQLHAQGAEMAFSYQGEALKRRVEPLAAEVGSDFLVECDVSDEAAMDETFRQIKEKWGSLDFVVHAIGFSNKDELEGRYLDTSRDNFALTMDISVYSFTAVAKRAEPLMNPGGSLLTLTYYGAVKYVPNYNVMGVAKAALEASVRYLAVDLGKNGIRVNAISAGAIKTLAAIAAKAVKEVDYHRDHSAQWVLRLGQGTEESRTRMIRALELIWPYVGELFEDDDLVRSLDGIAVVPSTLRAAFDEKVGAVLAEAELTAPEVQPAPGGGRRGAHSEYLGYILAELQVLARQHPGATW
jgi:enoyl-[acyl-carrier protein] reductase I